MRLPSGENIGDESTSAPVTMAVVRPVARSPA